jgi:hypothetical protein
MRRHVIALCLCAAALTMGGCANFIKDTSTTMWDVVPGTDDLKVEDSRLAGATLDARVQFVCQRQQYNATQVQETPYRILHELYEVPVGAVALVPGVIFFVATEVVTLTAAEGSFSRGPLDWAAAGLNPFLPVERGMFADRVRVREERKAALRDTPPQPYAAPVASADATAEVRLSVPGGPVGNWTRVGVGRELLVSVNLLEAAAGMPGPAATRVEVRMPVDWQGNGSTRTHAFTAFIPKELATRLFDARQPVEEIRRGSASARGQAADRLRQMGFGAEVERLLDAR